MGATQKPRAARLRNAFPVFLQWTFNENGNTSPELNVKETEAREDIFEAYGVESVSELAEKVTSGRRVDERRLGVLITAGEDNTFMSESDLLELVDGITEDLAAGLIDMEGDIPSLCEQFRRHGPVAVGDLLNDAKVEGWEWVDDFEEFANSLESTQETLEQRFKDAGVWAEPDTVAADY